MQEKQEFKATLFQNIQKAALQSLWAFLFLFQMLTWPMVRKKQAVV